MVCPICQGPTLCALTVRGIQIAACQNCTHRFSLTQLDADHAERTFGDDYFDGGGSGYPGYLRDGDLISRQASRYVSRIDPYLPDGRRGSLLDVGCAAGFVMRGLATGGWQVSGIDPNAKMVAHAREVLGLNATVATLETIDRSALDAPADGFDLITMIQVIAHLTDLNQSMRAVKSLLKPGGLVLVETWDCHSRTARLLNGAWHEYDPPTVVHNFNRQSLDALMSRYGLAMTAGGRPGKRISASHLRSALRHKYGKSAVGRVADLAVSPLPSGLALPYPAEDLFWRLYRND